MIIIYNWLCMSKTKCLKVFFLLLFALTLSSCELGIDPAAANSLSATLAVLGEYLLAILSIVLVIVFHLIRSLSVSLILLSILGLTNAVALPVSPYIVLATGALLLISFIVPIKEYSPKVIIDKNVKKVFERETREDNTTGRRIAIDLVVGILLLIIEYFVFSK